MIQLKDYQHRVLDSLREFLSECARTRDPAAAYEHVTAKVYGQPLSYVQIPDPPGGFHHGMQSLAHGFDRLARDDAVADRQFLELVGPEAVGVVAVGLAVTYLPFLLYKRLRGRSGMGLGDAVERWEPTGEPDLTREQISEHIL